MSNTKTLVGMATVSGCYLDYQHKICFHFKHGGVTNVKEGDIIYNLHNCSAFSLTVHKSFSSEQLKITICSKCCDSNKGRTQH